MHRFRTLAIALAAVVASLAFAPSAQAQTITACSASKSGSMYRVGITGTPSDCTNANHKKETWNVQGPQGPQGPQGVQGPQGAPGVSGYELVTVAATLQPGQVGSWNNVTCPTGKRVMGGGVAGDGSWNAGLKLSYSGPTYNGNGWDVSATNTSTLAVSFKIRIVCLAVAS